MEEDRITFFGSNALIIFLLINMVQISQGNVKQLLISVARGLLMDRFSKRFRKCGFEFFLPIKILF